MSDGNTSNQSYGGKKKAMLPYRLIQISATVVSAIALAAIALSLCPLKQESREFNDYVSEIICQGETNSQAISALQCWPSQASIQVFIAKGASKPTF